MQTAIAYSATDGGVRQEKTQQNMNTNSFQSEGYASVYGLLDSSLILQCKEELPSLFDAPTYYENSVTVRSVFESSPEKFRSNISLKDIPESEIFIGPSPLALSKAFRELVSEENLWLFASACLDVALDDLVLNYSQVIRKAPFFSPRINWHRDYGNSHISTQNSCDMVRVLIPLQEYVNSYGVTAVVPKSHLVTDKVAMEKMILEPRICEKVCVNVEIGCGDVLAINSKTIHGSETNETVHYRDQLVIQLAVGGAKYYTELDVANTEPYYLSSRLEICA